VNIELHRYKNATIGSLAKGDFLIRTPQEMLEFIVNCQYQGAAAVIVREEQLTPDFFDLRTGIAGDMLQKFSLYRCRLAIVGDFSKIASKALRDFIRESNRQGHICFVPSWQEALDALAT